MGVRDATAGTPAGAPPVDFTFLAEQTFGDEALARELLDLFVGQLRASLPALPNLARRAQDDLVHKLKGSCQAIGAGEAARACQAFEDAADAARAPAYALLAAAFAAAQTAAETHLASSLLLRDALR